MVPTPHHHTTHTYDTQEKDTQNHRFTEMPVCGNSRIRTFRHIRERKWFVFQRTEYPTLRHRKARGRREQTGEGECN